jgi:hypothetical protein
MLIPRQGTKFGVRIFPTRNACPNLPLGAGQSLPLYCGHAPEFRFSRFEFRLSTIDSPRGEK